MPTTSRPPVVTPTDEPIPAPAPNGPGFDRGRVVGGEGGQATAEYALVMLAAAALAGLLLAWASRAGGVDRLMNAVMDTLINQVG